MSKVLLISVKPEFAEKIVNGEKSIELRKCSPKVSKNDMVIIYSTDPVMAVVGICKVEEIIKMNPTMMWNGHKEKLGIDKKRFMAYYEDSKNAIGIVLKAACRLDQQIQLRVIKKIFPKFSPPQTFRYYAKSDIFKTYLTRIAG